MSTYTEKAFDEMYQLALNGEAWTSPVGQLSTAILIKAATGQVDLNIVARAMLACRGVDEEGKYVGFPAARQLWRARAHPGYAALGRRGGATVSEARIRANRANGKKGGRPKKQPQEQQ